MNTRDLMRQENIPVYQITVFDTAAAAHACPHGDMLLAQSVDAGLVSNIVFYSSKIDTNQPKQGKFLPPGILPVRSPQTGWRILIRT